MIAEPDWLTKLVSVNWSSRSRISSLTSASRSSTVTAFFLSAMSLNFLNASSSSASESV